VRTAIEPVSRRTMFSARYAKTAQGTRRVCLSLRGPGRGVAAQVTVAVRTSLLSCRKAEKVRTSLSSEGAHEPTVCDVAALDLVETIREGLLVLDSDLTVRLARSAHVRKAQDVDSSGAWIEQSRDRAKINAATRPGTPQLNSRVDGCVNFAQTPRGSPILQYFGCPPKPHADPDRL